MIFDLNDELRDKIADLIDQYIATPISKREIKATEEVAQ